MVKTFQCPSCGVRLLPDGSKSTLQCDYCGTTVIVPEELREPAARSGSIPGISIQINGVEQFGYTVIPPSKMDEIVRLIRDNQKINAIKEYRQLTGQGLKESKDVIDALERLLGASGAQHPEEYAALFATAARQAEPGVQPENTVTAPSVRIPRGVTALIGIVILITIIGAVIVPIIGAIGAMVAPFVISRQIEEQIDVSATIQAVVPTFGFPTLAPEPTPSPTPGYAALQLSFGREGIGAGQFMDVRNVTVDSDGRIYVGEYTGGRIQIFEADGTFVSLINIDPEMPLLGLEADRSGNLYVSQAGRITRYDTATGQPHEQLAPSMGRGFGSIALTQSGNIVAAYRGSTSFDDIVILDPTGTLLQTIPGAFSSQTGSPELDYSLAVDGNGNIYALGTFTVEVFKYSPEGRFLTRWGSRGDGKGQFRSVQDIAVDGQGRVYVCEVDRVQVFDSSGRLLGEIGRQESVMFGLAVSDADELLAAARTQVYRFTINE